MERITIEITRVALMREDLYECDRCHVIMDEDEIHDDSGECLCPECGSKDKEVSNNDS